MKRIFEFLTELKENNDREWFEANKSRYLELKAEYESVLQEIIDGIRTFDKTIGAVEPKDCVFRIYRDVRFSTDKSPYKTHFGAYIAAGGRKSERPGYYVHIEPGNSLIGGGSYMPKAEILKAIRQEIYFNSGEFEKIINSAALQEKFSGLYEDKLTRFPKEYLNESNASEYLKYKSFFVEKYLSDKEVLNKEKYISTVISSFKAMLPLKNFLNRVFD